MATKQNPHVALRHDDLDVTTSQPLSAARHLLDSGWKPADEQSAKRLAEFSGDDAASESSSPGKTAKEVKSSSRSSKSSDGKEGDK